MKKLAIVICCLLFCSLTPLNAFAEDERISVYVKGENVSNKDQYPIIVDGRTYLPVRLIIEAFEINVNWNQDDKTVILDGGNDEKVKIIVDQDYFEYNGQKFENKYVALLIDNRVMVPARFFEQLGYDVQWKSDTREVFIN